MYEYFFTFRSITMAQRAVRVLDRAGISNLLLRTPKQLEQMGCGYSVRVRSGVFQEAKWALQRGEVAYSSIYVRCGDGAWEAVGE